MHLVRRHKGGGQTSILDLHRITRAGWDGVTEGEGGSSIQCPSACPYIDRDLLSRSNGFIEVLKTRAAKYLSQFKEKCSFAFSQLL